MPKETQKKYDVGHLIGKLAQNLFPNGKDATPHQCYCERVIDMSKYNLPTILNQLLMIENTKLMIDENVIYEASFLFNATYASVDILVKESDKRIAYEVKSSTEISETFINDCAFQYYVISKNIRIDDFFLIYLNEEYIKKTNIPLQDLTMSNCDVNKLFVKESVLDRVIALQAAVSENVNKFKSILSGTEPIIKQGDHCHVPYECAFNDYCYKLKSNKFNSIFLE
ncbi:MAG: hypothetical protein HUJ83_11210 [Veillonella sp.]|nr:hypothetical protein [Veillonella sp.]